MATLVAITVAVAFAPAFSVAPARLSLIHGASRHRKCFLVADGDKATGEPPEMVPAAQEKEEETLEEAYEAGVEFGNDIKARFAAPRIDDPGLPYADALVCVSGSIFIAQVALLGFLPRPTWLEPSSFLPAWRGIQYILPALSHGAGLAGCWTLGALAAQAFERGAFTGTWQEAFARTWKGGAFATGILLLATQLSTFIALTERGLDPTTAGLGVDPAADYEVIRRGFEVICDIAVQCVGLTAFRLYRWKDARDTYL